MNNKNEQIEHITYFDLIKTFLIIGSITIGGGPGGLSIMQTYIVDRDELIDQNEMLKYITIGQSLPGVITVNISVLIGYKFKGITGAIISAISVISPAFFSVLFIRILLRDLIELEIIKKMFIGIRIGMIGIILNAFYSMFKVINWNLVYIFIFIIGLTLLIFTNMHPSILFATGGLLSLFRYMLKSKEVYK